VGHDTADDAGVYRVSPDLALIQTLDFFTPIVDDPYDFGKVAAANAMSDVYAMGGVPFLALNIVGYPVDTLSLDVLKEILRGAGDKCVEAEVAVVGGHSIDDPEPKFGLAVTGRVHPDRILRNDTAKPGDLLVLTKPLGVGILTTGIKQGKVVPEIVKAVVEQMAALNRGAGEAAIEVGAHAVTDVTGYGLLGHLYEMAAGSGLTAEVYAGAVPVLAEASVRALAAARVVPGGSRKNLAFIQSCAVFDEDLDETDRIILADAQTSGGLLLAVPPDRADDLLAALRAKGALAAALVGRLTENGPGCLHIRNLESP
jgi:selenide,water dikinase